MISLTLPFLSLNLLPQLWCIGLFLNQGFLGSVKGTSDLSYFGDTSEIGESCSASIQCRCQDLIQGHPCQEELCTLRTSGEMYQIRFSAENRLTSSLSSIHHVFNSSFSVIGRLPESCVQSGELVWPPGLRALISYCHGHLHAMIFTKEKKICIRPKELKLSTDGGDIAPHVAFHYPLSDNARSPLNDRQTRHSFITRRSVQEPKHLELLVVVGQDVYNFHKQDTERYILTNLNIAAELLRDASLGAQLRVHLTKMVILKEPELELQITKNLTSSLISLCKWSRMINPDNDSDPLHADLVLHVTRFDLESDDGNKMVRGVTQLGGLCSQSWSCVITEDTGFNLGITIAHEIGHSFGINHDGHKNDCVGNLHIMAAEGGYNSVDLTWSKCSRDQFVKFFSTRRGTCLDDLPATDSDLSSQKPGLYYGVDDQCKRVFGGKASSCSFSKHDIDVCNVLSCHTDPSDHSTCKRLFIPLLEGTECGPNKWCLRRSCTSLGDLKMIGAVHGAWSTWTPFSSCSRSCGGGVSLRHRHCNNPRPAFGGRKCEGADMEAEMCNTQPCQESQFDFMASQCSKTNSQPLDLTPRVQVYYKWLPAVGYAKGSMLCKYMCRVEGKNFMLSRGDSFVDGTRCESSNLETTSLYNLCVKGNCRVFGCDGKLDSGQMWDSCMVCGGDNSSCQKLVGSFTEGTTQEYVTFLTIPPHSTNVRISNSQAVFSHLGVKVKDQYVVAGARKISLNTSYPSNLEDNRVVYRLYLTQQNLPASEEIIINGPTREAIEIQVYRKYGKEYGDIVNPNITYSLYVPRREHSYIWLPVTEACSTSCGPGTTRVHYICSDQNSAKEVELQHCSRSTRPPDRLEACNTAPCPPWWEVGEFGACNVSCDGGWRERDIRCLKQEALEIQQTSDADCADSPRPESIEMCNNHSCPVRWNVSESGVCSVSCGVGIAERSVICVQFINGADVEVNKTLCPVETQPPDIRPCIISICPFKLDQIPWSEVSKQLGKEIGSVMNVTALSGVPTESRTYLWVPIMGSCSVSCGEGVSEIRYVCINAETKEESQPEYCDQNFQPQMYYMPCTSKTCPPWWKVHEYGPCNVSCGGGVREREVYCVKEESHLYQRVPPFECGNTPKPASMEICNSHPCPVRWWYKSESCSVPCGGGVRRRLLYCAKVLPDHEELTSDKECLHLSRPEDLEFCNLHPCPPRWQVSEPGRCSVLCGTGLAERKVTCVQLHNGTGVEVNRAHCLGLEEPLSRVPCVVSCPFGWNPQNWTECSVSCGHGVRSRQLLCVNLDSTEVVLDAFCDELTKPATKEPCDVGPCSTQSTNQAAALTWAPTGAAAISLTATVTPQGSRTDTTTPAKGSRKEGVCGKLVLSKSGMLNLTNLQVSECTVSIGRPLDEVITIRVLSSSLNCSRRDTLALCGRRLFWKVCSPLKGFTLTSVTNTLTVRQRSSTKGSGVVLQYSSSLSSRQYHRECDVQLYGPWGIIVSPMQSYREGQACRTFINVSPMDRIIIRVLHLRFDIRANTTTSDYILIKDVSTQRYSAYRGNSLFLWQSLGNSVEIEFHGDFRFRALFRAVPSRTMRGVHQLYCG
ncbi:A disintegrin and metalloproteinase with thrombospondin motifs 13 isoform X1 [Pristis pectinata]|uniref:A disintegrin and metalloproteinase with thrombospondin motifs 13 isoform X1 n=2 Tax=Pristis pectinata TaxID=685728 RepID=UPI00223CDAA5|nr:A disintegrin and metalloproteinase with thrombospondin motifs 13 isoform X1 [Pristis pectinata]